MPRYLACGDLGVHSRKEHFRQIHLKGLIYTGRVSQSQEKYTIVVRDMVREKSVRESGRLDRRGQPLTQDRYAAHWANQPLARLSTESHGLPVDRREAPEHLPSARQPS